MNGLVDYLSEQRTWDSSTVSQKRLAVEAQFFLDHIVAPLDERLLLAISGEPRTLQSHVVAALEGLRSVFDHRILFVFNGVSPIVSPFSSEFERLAPAVQNFWSVHDGTASFKFTGGSGSLVTERELWLVLQSLREDCLVAPQRAWAQLAYLMRDGFVDFVLGSAATLLFGDGNVRLVTNINMEHKSVCFCGR
jgi:hypothetical protein